MKRFKTWGVEGLAFASAHVGTAVLWLLMRRRGLVARYLVVLAWNVQVFMCVVALYAFCFYVVTLPYVPGLP